MDRGAKGRRRNDSSRTTRLIDTATTCAKSASRADLIRVAPLHARWHFATKLHEAMYRGSRAAGEVNHPTRAVPPWAFGD